MLKTPPFDQPPAYPYENHAARPARSGAWGQPMS